jgi:hypothetical protein
MANEVRSILEGLFPANPFKRVISEHYVNSKGTKLFFDFYVKELTALIEVQGRQHSVFVEHFHGTAENFKAQKFRDNLKIQYVQENNMHLVRIYDTEKINEDLMLDKIHKALDSEYNYHG